MKYVIVALFAASLLHASDCEKAKKIDLQIIQLQEQITQLRVEKSRLSCKQTDPLQESLRKTQEKQELLDKKLQELLEKSSAQDSRK